MGSPVCQLRSCDGGIRAETPLGCSGDAAIGFELDAVLCGEVKFDPSKSRRCATDQVAPLHIRGHLRHAGHEIFLTSFAALGVSV
jgi:hypothetical protein